MAKSKVTASKKSTTKSSKTKIAGGKAIATTKAASNAGEYSVKKESKAGSYLKKEATLRTIKSPARKGTITLKQAREAVRAVMAMRREQATSGSEVD